MNENNNQNKKGWFEAAVKNIVGDNGKVRAVAPLHHQAAYKNSKCNDNVITEPFKAPEKKQESKQEEQNSDPKQESKPEPKEHKEKLVAFILDNSTDDNTRKLLTDFKNATKVDDFLHENNIIIIHENKATMLNQFLESKQIKFKCEQNLK